MAAVLNYKLVDRWFIYNLHRDPRKFWLVEVSLNSWKDRLISRGKEKCWAHVIQMGLSKLAQDASATYYVKMGLKKDRTVHMFRQWSRTGAERMIRDMSRRHSSAPTFSMPALSGWNFTVPNQRKPTEEYVNSDTKQWIVLHYDTLLLWDDFSPISETGICLHVLSAVDWRQPACYFYVWWGQHLNMDFMCLGHSSG